jgi:hypothetical protein
MEGQIMNLLRPPQLERSTTSAASPSQVIPRWVAATACLGILLLAAGAMIALVQPSLLLAPNDHVTHGVKVYGDYLFSRNLAIAVLLAAALVARARPLLAALMALTALIQLLDIVLDAATARWVLIPGLLVFAAAFTLGAARLTDQLPWHAQRTRQSNTTSPPEGTPSEKTPPAQQQTRPQ